MSKVIIWRTGLDDFFDGKSIVGGLVLQLSIWARVFMENGSTVFALSGKKTGESRGIRFLAMPPARLPLVVRLLLEPLYAVYYLIRLRPCLVLLRGTPYSLSYIAPLGKILRIQVVLQGASDRDYDKGNELISSRIARLLFRFGMWWTDKVIVQNQRQEALLEKNYGQKNVRLIPNIWYADHESDERPDERHLILWVGNFRSLKRPEWFIELARKFPGEHFAMIGAPMKGSAVYETCKMMSQSIPNLEMTGGMSLEETNEYFRKAKLLVCTSEVEGFPNTFLQAWSNRIPVIATVDPNGAVSTHEVGVVVADEVELSHALHELLSAPAYYARLKANVEDYFVANHSPQKAYGVLCAMVSTDREEDRL